MTRRAAAILALLLLALITAPETRATDGALTGFASAYAPGVMSDVIRVRFERGYWPVTPDYDWYTAAGFVAVLDCRDVGRMKRLIDPSGREHRVMVADCCARHDTCSWWMPSNSIIVELDYGLWQRLTAAYGRPLEVSLR